MAVAMLSYDIGVGVWVVGWIAEIATTFTFNSPAVFVSILGNSVIDVL